MSRSPNETGRAVSRSTSRSRCRLMKGPRSGLSSSVNETPSSPQPHHFIPRVASPLSVMGMDYRDELGSACGYGLAPLANEVGAPDVLAPRAGRRPPSVRLRRPLGEVVPVPIEAIGVVRRRGEPGLPRGGARPAGRVGKGKRKSPPDWGEAPRRAADSPKVHVVVGEEEQHS